MNHFTIYLNLHNIVNQLVRKQTTQLKMGKGFEQTLH